MAVASLDCEMELGANGTFPRAETERLLCACLTVVEPNNATASRVAFMLDAPAEPNDFADDVYSFAGDERALLLALGAFLHGLQAVLVTGWNVEPFVLSYLAQRADALSIGDAFSSLLRHVESILDLAPYFKRAYKFRSEILGEEIS